MYNMFKRTTMLNMTLAVPILDEDYVTGMAYLGEKGAMKAASYYYWRLKKLQDWVDRLGEATTSRAM